MDKLPDESAIDLTFKKDQPLIHNLEESDKNMNKKNIIAFLLIIIAGIISGYILSKNISPRSQSLKLSGNQASLNDKSKTSVNDTVYKDSTEGILEKGGIDGEGTHKLIRPGGPSQTVYLTSSVMDMSQYEGKKVRVWGETFAAAKAGWLMDVGKIEIIN